MNTLSSQLLILHLWVFVKIQRYDIFTNYCSTFSKHLCFFIHMVHVSGHFDGPNSAIEVFLTKTPRVYILVANIEGYFVFLMT